jgi:hypothetical protein
MTTREIGAEGFKWFFGFVEDINDPENLGMVRVRVPHLHGNMPVDQLPWATLVMPPNSASLMGVGMSPTGIDIGAMVFGFFADGNEHNIPVIIGTINKINGNDKSKHDVSKLARGTNSIKKNIFGSEPASAYKAKYPYNKTLTTKSGHAIEIDDTPGQERLHVYHKSGTYVEINKDGRMVTKVQGDDFEVIVKNKEVLIGGNVKINVKGNVDFNVAGTFKLNASSIVLNDGTSGAARAGDSITDNDNESNGPDNGSITSGSSSVFIG